MLYSNEDEDQIEALAETFEDYDEVDSISSYPTLLGKQYTVDEMVDYIGDMTDEVSITEKTLSILYYDYYAGDELPEMTVSEFLTLMSTLAEDETFASYLGDDIGESLNALAQYADAELLTTQMSAEELAGFFGMDTDTVSNLLLMYSMQMAAQTGISADASVTMSPQEFINFLATYVLADETYAAMFDADTQNSLLTAQSMITLVVEGETYTADEMAEMFGSLSDDLDADTMELLYLYNAATTASETSWTLSPYELFSYLADDLVNDARFDSLLTDEFREQIAAIKTELDDGIKQLKGENYSLLAFSTSFAEESEATTNFLETLNTYCEENLSGDFYLIGSSVMVYEMQNGFDDELLQITLLTVIAIFLVVALTFRSIVIPAVLVLIVQCGVYITIATCGLIGYDIYYLALLIVQCILMGASIDYGILFTNYYRESRSVQHLERTEALAASYGGASHAILTSGLIMILVTGILGLSPMVDSTVAQICLTIAIGTTYVVLLILFVLPGVLAAADRFVVKRKK